MKLTPRSPLAQRSNGTPSRTPIVRHRIASEPNEFTISEFEIFLHNCRFALSAAFHCECEAISFGHNLRYLA